MNEPPREHIPGRRRRLVVLLAVAAVIGVAAAVAVAVSATVCGAALPMPAKTMGCAELPILRSADKVIFGLNSVVLLAVP